MTQRQSRTLWADTRDEMAQRVALDIPDGSAYVNLGIGIPELIIAKYVPEGREFIYHTENGLLGMGPSPEPGQGEPGADQRRQAPGDGDPRRGLLPPRGQLRDDPRRSPRPVRARRAAGLQNGDLANWSTGAPDAIPAVGGAMDLVAGVKTIYVITQHCTKHGRSRSSSRRAAIPLTGLAVVDRIYTDLAVIDVTPDGFQLVELSPGVSFDYVQERTGRPPADRRDLGPASRNHESTHVLRERGALRARARRSCPGGVSRNTVLRKPHPLYADHASGCRVTDIEGVERIDFANNMASLIHGHATPRSSPR